LTLTLAPAQKWPAKRDFGAIPQKIIRKYDDIRQGLRHSRRVIFGATGHTFISGGIEMEKVSGIGGFFFRAKDPKALTAWYHQHLGVSPVPTGAGQEPWEQEAGTTAFSPFPENSKYFGDDKKVWMLNFRVRDLDKMAAQLAAAGIEVKIDPNTDYGKFGRLHDPEGNPIELWQPTD
jgi:predicted enzyme related to lactoylglutathione lyase